MSTNTTVAAFMALSIGLGGGYIIGSNLSSISSIEHNMSMRDIMHSMDTELEGKQGSDFDKAFLAEMIVHHESAIQMAKMALAQAGHAEIKQMAEAIISAQNAEIQQMQEWQAAWY